MTTEQTIILAMARALFVQAYADQEEEAGRSIGAGHDWMDAAPKTPKYAVLEAYKLAGCIQQINNASLVVLLAAARRADGLGDSKADVKYASDFGHYLAMQSLGHGVSWNDDHAEVVLTGKTMVLPHFEFYIESQPEPEFAP